MRDPWKGTCTMHLKALSLSGNQPVSMGELRPIHSAPLQGVSQSLGHLGGWRFVCISQYFPYTHTGLWVQCTQNQDAQEMKGAAGNLNMPRVPLSNSNQFSIRISLHGSVRKLSRRQHLKRVGRQGEGKRVMSWVTPGFGTLILAPSPLYACL